MSFLAPFIGPLAIGGMVGGTLLRAYGANQQAKAEAAAYNYNAKMRIAEAESIRQAGIDANYQANIEKRRILSSRRAAYAKAGVLMEGSPLETQLETASNLSIDIERQAQQYRFGVASKLAESQLQSFYAKQAKKAGRLDVASALVGGVGQIAAYGGLMGWFDKPSTVLTSSGSAIKGLPSGYNGMGW